MIFHNKQTITIGRFAEMVTMKDFSLVKRINVWMPEFILKIKYSALVIEFNKLINGKEIHKLISKDLHKLSMLNRINIQYPALIKLINLEAKFKRQKLGSDSEYNEFDEIVKNAYYNIYKRNPQDDCDYKKVANDYIKLKKKYMQMYPVNSTQGSKLDVEELIMSIETILSPMVIRDKKLYTLPYYLDSVTKKQKGNG